MSADVKETVARLREVGWSVAVHNDYRLNGQPATFWLLTHPSGVWAKGEGSTDADALADAERQAIERLAASNSPDVLVEALEGLVREIEDTDDVCAIIDVTPAFAKARAALSRWREGK